MKKNFVLSWRGKNISNFIKSHGFIDADQLTIVEYKKLMFSVIESLLEKKITADEFLDLSFELWAPDNDSDDKATEELKNISYLLSELSYNIGNTLEEHLPVLTNESKNQEVVYPYNSFLNEILRYYLDHRNDL